ncbi:MAG: GNAT family N-acetyltransferase [Chloroflexi bacterium]|nr:GNAT family N-acetyltransferase [Chloroflexota bacterium]
MSNVSEFRIEPATESDISLILSFIKGLAQYEGLAHEVVATEDNLRESLFGPGASTEAVIAYSATEPVGFAVFFQNYSTFLGRCGLYLEDLFVLPEWRGRGLGRSLLGYVARIAVTRGCGRLEWSVLDRNEPAIRFYRALGASPVDEWTIYRLTGDPLERLSGEFNSAK